MVTETCDHVTFTAHVHVSRITDGEDGPVTHYNTTLRVACAVCGTEFTFLGLPRGVNLDEPVAGAFGIEARLPIRPLAPKDLNSEVMKVVVPNPFEKEEDSK